MTIANSLSIPGQPMTDDQFRQCVQEAIEKSAALAAERPPDVFLMTAEVEAILLEHIPPASAAFSSNTSLRGVPIQHSMALHGIPIESYMRPEQVQVRAMELRAKGKHVMICELEDETP